MPQPFVNYRGDKLTQWIDHCIFGEQSAVCMCKLGENKSNSCLSCTCSENMNVSSWQEGRNFKAYFSKVNQNRTLNKHFSESTIFKIYPPILWIICILSQKFNISIKVSMLWQSLHVTPKMYKVGSYKYQECNSPDTWNQ